MLKTSTQYYKKFTGSGIASKKATVGKSSMHGL